jgi:hypothetical protein
LAYSGGKCRFVAVKTLTVEEATPGLGRLLDLALAGEQIQIRKGSGVVELRPTLPSPTTDAAQLSPREALRQLQKGARLTGGTCIVFILQSDRSTVGESHHFHFVTIRRYVGQVTSARGNCPTAPRRTPIDARHGDRGPDVPLDEYQRLLLCRARARSPEKERSDPAAEGGVPRSGPAKASSFAQPLGTTECRDKGRRTQHACAYSSPKLDNSARNR